MAVADFPQQPGEYHRAMLQVAREEVIHTRMLLHRLRELGGELGSDPVHLALFETASAHSDLPARLAVVPRILEAAAGNAVGTAQPGTDDKRRWQVVVGHLRGAPTRGDASLHRNVVSS